ncbi:light-harvesting protein [Thalassococcus sp. S3]|uniref:light-harvesting protein n=1 Tax=Thalassococcus sp. S3 TaxID=2017482 RepID=UPI001023FEBA|nr:light-harvesting protein [Thalassococcus sp. S3]QBF30255.1 light-harvesting protein [Thalassococcus sp. S3]
MNNAKMWLVVPPAVGVPLFLGAVAVGSFSVHVAVLSNTSWVSDFLSGVPLGSGDAEEAAMLKQEDAATSKASYVLPAPDGGQQVLVILPDGTTRAAVLQPPEVTAAGFASPPNVLKN